MKRTLPVLVASWGENLDRARALVRTVPALRALGELYGPTRAYSEDEAAQIRAALKADREKRTRKTGAVLVG